MVVDSHREGALGLLLPNHPRIKELTQFTRTGQLVEATDLLRGGELLLDDLVAQIDALITDVDPGASDELLDLLLALSAEGTLEEVPALTNPRHPALLLVGRPTSSRPSGRSFPEVCAVHHSRGRYLPRRCRLPCWVTTRNPAVALETRGPPHAGRELVRRPHREVRTSSIRPYSLAPWAVRYLSRSMSLDTCSTL